uniref:Uncharacterized protein n=1 Tax=Arundo donax TaxID=35708 RepID=A0A0A8Z6L3_ARUDO
MSHEKMHQNQESMEKYLERKWKVIPQWKTEKQQQ